MQELEKVIPEVVYGKNGSKTIAYGHLTAVLVNAVKEQQKIIDKQSERINKLEEKLCHYDKKLC